jgi:hypothetical protein
MLPAGRYFVGDLSVVLKEEEVEFVKTLTDGICILKDGRMIVKYKVDNGIYRSNQGTLHSIEIGYLGAVPANNYEKSNMHIVAMNKHGCVFPIYREWEPNVVGGDIQFGDIIVDTSKDGYFGSESVSQLTTE